LAAWRIWAYMGKQRSVMLQALSAEFPNDNPDLHLGTIWVNREPCGPPEAEMRDIEEIVIASVTSSEEQEGTPTVINAPVAVVDLAAESESVSAPSEPEHLDVRAEVAPPAESMIVLSAPSTDEIEPPVDEIVVEELDFDLSQVPLESGAASAPSEESSPAPTPEDDAYATLVATLVAVFVAQGGAGDAVSALLAGDDAMTAAAWARILRGESDDISTCGAAMLDEWAADVVARALGAPGRSAQIRRELRDRGVCAFGLVEAA
jgi:hypothetical protein